MHGDSTAATRPVALITGGSSGIGEAFAELLANQGWDLVLVARRVERLRDIAERLVPLGTSVEVAEADLGTSEGIDAMLDRVRSRQFDLLVLSAGVAHYGDLVDLDAATVESTWNVNITSALRIVHAALASMVPRRSGGVIVISSALAFGGSRSRVAATGALMPRRAVYAASKAAAVALVRALSVDLEGTSVLVSAVCPGVVATEWNGGAGRDLPTAMAPADVAVAAWADHRAGLLVSFPGLPDRQDWAALEAAELALVQGANHRDLPERYTIDRSDS